MASSKAPDAITFNKHVNALSDRESWEMVMLGASLLDVALAESIARHTDELSARERNRLDQGVTRDLSTRIDAAWAFGLITLRTARECHKVRDLRNKMAHSIMIGSLDDPPLRDIVNNFEYHHREKIEVAGDGITVSERAGGYIAGIGPGYDVIRSANRRIGFYVPTSTGADFTNPEVRVRHQIWSCIYATVAPKLGDWLADRITLVDEITEAPEPE